MRFRYLIVDVFSDRPFGGNQLAVLTDAQGLTETGMQAVTREFNFAETTFVLPADDPAHSRRVRIFTPGRELPFAGHPTVGTACALVMDGQAPAGTLVLEEGIGPIRVEVSDGGGAVAGRFTVEQAPELAEAAISAADAAAILSLDQSAVTDVFAAALGVEFTFIALASRDAVDSARLDMAEWSRRLAGRFGEQVHVFAGELIDGGEIYARMFGPALGIAEDPATGSAAATLVGAAAIRAGADGDFLLAISQGVAMGRPSRIDASAEVRSGAVERVHVSGAAAFVASGGIEVPAEYLLA